MISATRRPTGDCISTSETFFRTWLNPDATSVVPFTLSPRKGGEGRVRGAGVSIEPPAPPAVCMAKDAAMIQSAAHLNAGTIVRIYEWSHPAISLGRSNNAGCLNEEKLREGGVVVVHRPTGGAALVHGTDISLSVAVPRAALAGASLLDLGRRLATPMLEALRALGFHPEFRDCKRFPLSFRGEGRRGLPLCFLQKSGLDILVGGFKVAAFAQRKTAQVFFQHGSLLVDPIPEPVKRVLQKGGLGTREEWRQVDQTVKPLCGFRAINPHEIKKALADAAENLPASPTGV